MATFEPGSWIWLPHEEEMFLPAQVVNGFRPGEAGEVKTEDGETHSLAANETGEITACDPQVLSADVDNLIALNNLNESALLHNLRIRFKGDMIYTNVSSILISVNPFKLLPLYTPEVLDRYKETGGRDLPPHVFAVADQAYRHMLNDNESQSVIISGESGAGKTEATKLILQYLAEVSGRADTKAKGAGAGAGSEGKAQEGLEQQILKANPVMEAFGNAKTVRNNNSSRFGKLIEVNFDRSGKIVGGLILNYLLEKSRVVHQMEGERNYHGFYQLLAGVQASPELRQQLALTGVPEDYYYLSQSGVSTAEGISDEKEYEDMVNAMEVLGIDADERLWVFKTVASLLHFGNVELVPEVRPTEEDGARINNPEVLQQAASLLALNIDTLDKALCYRNIGTRSVIFVPYTVEQAKDARDGLVKSVYAKMFDWLIKKINVSLASGVGADHGATNTKLIGVLDIFGFESFELNSFEQLCINYCNEKLQFHFNEHIFRLEQEEYKAEGVIVPDTTFVDNQPCLDLLELRAEGIFAMIDEEINVPKGSDQGFLSKVLTKHAKHQNFERPRPNAYRDAQDCFVVKHYAGAVAYNVANFLEKNKDSLHPDIMGVLRSSESAFVRGLYEEENAAAEAAPARGGRSARGGKKKIKTLGAQFKGQLEALMTTLRSTFPHFIRCMKPNSLKRGDIFESEMMLAQLRYAGLLEVCRIRQIGFPVRKDFDAFFKRYKPCAPMSHSLDELLAAMSEKGVLVEGEWAKGTSKVFCRNLQSTQLEAAREEAFIVEAMKVQKVIRGFLMRAKYRAFMRTLTQLREAVASREKEALEHNIHMCDELPHGGAHLEVVKEGKALLARLVEEERIVRLLQDGIDSRDADTLASALAAAEGMTPPLEHPKLAEARELQERLQEERRVRDELKEAIKARDKAQLEALLSRADELDMDTDETRQAAALKTRLEEEEQTVQQLKDAIADRSLNEITGLLTKMSEMGLSSPEVAEAEALKETLTQELQAKNAVNSAIQARDLEQLNAALARAEALGLQAAEEVVAGQTLKNDLEHEAEVTAQLTAAVEARDLAAITAAIEAGSNIHLTAEVCSVFGDAQALKGTIEAENACIAACEAAAGSGEMGALGAALAEANKLGLDHPAVATVREMTAKLGAQSETRSKLDAAAASTDLAQVEAALAEAQAMGLGDTPEAAACTATAERLREEQGVLEELRSAMEHQQLTELSRAVAMCMRMNLAARYPEDVSAAKELVASLSASMKIGLQLKAASANRDIAEVDAALAKAQEAGIESDDVVAARALRVELEREGEVTAQVTAALESKDDEALEAALKLAADEGFENDKIRQARILKDRAGMIEETQATMAAAVEGSDYSTLNECIERFIELGYEGADLEAAKAKRDELSVVREAASALSAAINTLNVKAQSASGIAPPDITPVETALAAAKERGLPEASPEHTEATELIERMHEQLKVQEDLAAALASNEYRPLSRALAAAEDLGLTLDAVQRVKTVLRDLEAERRAAQQAGTLEEEDVDEEELERERQARLARAGKKQYHFTYFNQIRSVDDFAKGVILNKKRVKEGMLRWQGTLVSKSILQLDKDLNKIAIRIHKSLLGYMGDKTMSFPATLARDVLEKGLEYPPLVDEIYIQIMKQLTGNPKPESIARGWQLMCMAVGTFPPSREFEPYLLNYILVKSTSSGAVGNYAKYSLRRLEGMLSSGASGFVPSVEEIQAYKERPPILATIELVDGTALTEDLPVTPDLNVGKVLEICTHFLDLQDPRSEFFGIFVVDVDAEYEEAGATAGGPPPTPQGAASELPATPRPLRSEDHMGDVCVQKSRQGRAYKFVFKRKIYLRNADGPSDDQMYNRLIYLQAADEVINGNVPIVDENQVALLTAQSLAIDLGPDMADTAGGLVEQELIEYLPFPWRLTYDIDAWATKVLAKRDEVLQVDPDDLQNVYVESIKTHELYGTHFFHVKKVNDVPAVADLPVRLIACFNSDGLSFANTDREILLTFGYADIYRWGGSSIQFSLIIWSAASQDTFELVLNTLQAADMASIILDHINAIMSAAQ